VNRTSPKSFFRISPDNLLVERLEQNQEVQVPAEICRRVKPGDGLVVAEWDETALLGRVVGLVVVTSVDRDKNVIKGEYARADITLRPNPSGRRYWKAGAFGFAPAVVERYMLEDLFAEPFPGYSGLEFRPAVGTRHAASEVQRESPGYVYVIESKHGYKIGRTVNLKQRTQLFAVKLPFDISLVFAGHFDDYIGAEASLHRMFASKRLEGEWFDLGEKELEKIKAFAQAFGRLETGSL
jgi:hypothetical protein